MKAQQADAWCISSQKGDGIKDALGSGVHAIGETAAIT
jgi:hypothetical protein